MPANDTRNPDQIERDIRTTQRDMSATVNKLEEQLTARNIMNTLLDKSDENGVDGRYLMEQARRNPIALGMIAIGGLWLVSDADAKPSAFTGSSKKKSSGPDEDFHLGYVEHMRTCEHRPDEDWDAWRRRRDQHRASYLLIEPRHDEDETSYRKRLDEATEGMRKRTDEAAEYARNMARKAYEGAENMAHDTYDGAGRMASKARGAYRENPLIGGLAAAFVGAVAGSLIPVSRTEEEQFGRLGADAIDEAKNRARQAGKQAKDKAEQVGEQVLDKKDDYVDKADREIREAGKGQGSGGQTPTTRTQEFGKV